MKVFVALLVFIIFAPVVKADTVSAERVQIEQIGSAFRIFSKENLGEVPRSWSDISKYYDLEFGNRTLVGRQSYPIQDHYEFISNPALVLEDGSRVLFLRTIPLRRSAEPGGAIERQWRYLICQRKDGKILSLRIPENAIQTMLRNSGVSIVPKSGLPPIESDERQAGTEPLPQRNPADEQFLKEHPELDPLKGRATQSSVKQASSQQTRIEVGVKTGFPLFLVITLTVVAVMIVGVVSYLRRR